MDDLGVGMVSSRYLIASWGLMGKHRPNHKVDRPVGKTAPCTPLPALSTGVQIELEPGATPVGSCSSSESPHAWAIYVPDGAEGWYHVSLQLQFNNSRTTRDVFSRVDSPRESGCNSQATGNWGQSILPALLQFRMKASQNKHPGEQTD